MKMMALRQLAMILIFLLSPPAFALTPLQKTCKEGPLHERVDACAMLINELAAGDTMRRTYSLNRAEALIQLNRCPEALEIYDDLINSGEEARRGNFLYDKFVALRNCRLYEEALVVLQMVEESPVCQACPDVPLDKGNIFSDQGKLDEAIIFYSEAIALADEPKDKGIRQMALSGRSLAFAKKTNYKLALIDIDAAIKLNPNNWESQNKKSEILRIQGNFGAAIKAADKAVALDKTSFVSYSIRCRLYRYIGQTEKALKDCTTAIAKSPKFPLAYAERGLLFERIGQPERAASDYRKAISLDGFGSDTSPDAHKTAAARLAAIESGSALITLPSLPENSKPGIVPTTTIPPPEGAPSIITERRVALVIGNGHYGPDDILPNVPNDANGVAAALERVGFQSVIKAVNADKAGFVAALRSFSNEAEKADWAVIYYAGHGVEIDGVNYLLPVGIKIETDRDIKFEGIPLEQVLEALPSRKLRLVLLDACRNNPFLKTLRRTEPPPETRGEETSQPAFKSRSVGPSLGDMTTKSTSGALIVYSARHGQVALDGEGSNSPFVVSLAQRIATPGVDVTKVFRLVRDDVMESTGGRQEPYTYGSLSGREDYYFAASKSRP